MSKRKRKRRPKRRAAPVPPPPPRAGRSWVAALVVALVLAAAAYGIWRVSTPSASDSGTHVLLITLDTVRADRLGSYGYARANTPALDALADAGVRFDQAYCQAPMTLPSHVSMFTGMYPLSTGVHINGAVGLGRNVATLAELFRGQGYRTGAFIAADVLHSSFGLDRGFDVYDDDLAGEDGEARSERPADHVADAALDWLGRASDRPFFAWVHFYDAHKPYSPPPAFAGESGAYDGEVAFVDSQVRRLLDWLEARGLRERTLIVVAGDHGEGLGDHDEATHGVFVYNSTVRVPLIVQQVALHPRTIQAPVELVDLFPTLVDLLELDPPAQRVDGRSLARALRSGKVPGDPVYGESEYARLGFGWGALRFMLVDEWKYIDAPRAELYDRREDPGERNNVIDEHPEIAERLRGELAEFTAFLEENRPEATAEAPDPGAVERLSSLGYVATTLTPEDFDDTAPLRDPKDMIDVVEGFEDSLIAFRQGDFAGAVQTLTPLAQRSPESDELFTLLGFAYLRLGRFAEAQQALETSLKRHQDHRRRWWALGMALRNQNRLEAALECFLKSIEVSPDYDLAHREAATVLSQLGRVREAEPHWERCVALDPTSVPCLTNLGSIRLMSRQPAEAADLLQRAVARDPGNEHAHRGLWQALLGAGRRADALKSLERAQAAFPEAPAFRCPLAWFRATARGASAANLRQAIDWATACSRAEPGNPRHLDALAAAYAASGEFSRAVTTAEQALAVVSATGREELRAPIEARLRLYRQQQSYVE